MSLALLGLALALAAHVAVATAGSLVVALLLPVVEPRLARLSAGARASGFLALALLPAAGGLVAGLFVVVPAWIAREPAGAAERLGPALALPALAGAVLVVARLGSGLALLRRGSRAAAGWARGGQAFVGLPLPATRFEHELPVAALVGLARPRLLLANRLVAALDREELRAVVAHELGHAAARDNLKRLLLAASPDPLVWLPAGARLRRAFEEAAEEAADLAACASVAPLHLARALVKAAALVPPGRRLALPLPGLHNDEPLARRVRALADREPQGAPSGTGSPRRAALALALLGGLLGLATAAAVRPEAHALLETLVRELS